MQNKVSVIVPVYNGEKFLEKCIRSICDQTLREIEILVVDDGSTDGSGKTADALAAEDSRIRVIHQENKGLSGARNTGIEAAQGDFIGFVDADDWIHPAMYEKLYNAAVSMHSEVVTGAMQVITLSGAHRDPVCPQCPTQTRLDPQQVRQLMPEFVCNGFLPFVWRRLYAARLFREEGVRSDTRYGICEDATFCMECLLRANGVAAIEDALYYYHSVPDSLMQNKKYKPRLTDALLLQYTVKTELTRTFMPEQAAEMKAAIASDTRRHISFLLLNNIYRKGSHQYPEFRKAASSPLMRDMYRCIPLRSFFSRSLDLVSLLCIGLRLYLPAYWIGKRVFGK